MPVGLLPAAGYGSSGSNWHAGLIEEFTTGTREGASAVTRRSVLDASRLVLGSFWRIED